MTSQKRSSKSKLSRIQAIQRPPPGSSQITCQHSWSRYDTRLEEGIAASTARRELALVSHVFTIARKEWRMASLSNPVDLIRQPCVDNARERRMLSTDVWIPKDGDLLHEHLDELEMSFRLSRSAELPKNYNLRSGDSDASQRNGRLTKCRR